MDYCKEEKAELARFEKAYFDKKAELKAFDNKHGATFLTQKVFDPMTVARDVADGKATAITSKVSTELLDKRAELHAVLDLLQQAVAEQKRHVSEKLKREYWNAYPKHPKTLEACKALHQAMELIDKALKLDIQANAALAKEGLPAHNGWRTTASNHFFNETIRLKKMDWEKRRDAEMLI